MKSALIGLTIVSGATVACPAWAAPPNKYSFQGSSAYAYLITYDDTCTCVAADDVCLYTNVFVSGFDDLSKQAPSPSQAYVEVYQYDYCTGTYPVYASGNTALNSTQFVVGKKASNANLVAEISGFDYINGTDVTFAVNLSWLATEAASRFHGVYHDHSPHYIRVSRSKGNFAPANAAGVVSLNGTDYVENPNPAYSFAGISAYGEGSIFHQKK
jgi:hypothetical protein